MFSPFILINKKVLLYLIREGNGPVGVLNLAQSHVITHSGARIETRGSVATGSFSETRVHSTFSSMFMLVVVV